MKHNLTGEVVNRTGGVTVVIECDRERAERFARDIRDHAPPAAVVRSVQLRKTMIAGFTGFSIRPSLDADETITEVSPDIAVCRECLDDLETDPGRRGYPFINCTNCGPRFTIIRALPYDRINTSMAAFEMCPRCAAEYRDISDRRFHAQPVACNSCGPVYTLKAGDLVITSIKDILEEIALRLASGGSVAIKSTGGYNLMCDALNESAVAGLRRRKQRDSKPFAVMFRDINAVHEYCHVEAQEEATLESWRRPVVILQQKMPLASSVSSGLNTTGAMLPHMPIHHMLFRHIATPALVLTSGNLSAEPIITLDSQAELDLMPVTGCIVSYNREINNRADDSVVRVINGNISLIRRSRGYAPEPVDMTCSVEGVFAAGAEQKNSFCIGRGRQAFMSQYIGDLLNLSTYDFYLDSLRLFTSLFRFTPSHVACDMHPDYLSGRFAREMAQQNGVPLVRVQHHHAHGASVMAEHRLEGTVIGVILDGTGFGSDGNIWGSEFMILSPLDFERYTHFDYFMMPGGDIAADEPWRMALSCLFRYFGNDYDLSSVKLFRRVDGRKLETVSQMLVNGINSPLTCGAGRIFDAVSALLLLCTESSFDSEAPMRLESAVPANRDEYYPYSLNETVGLGPTFEEILNDLEHPDIPGIAARFHNTVAHIILDVCKKIRRETGLKRVVLSGGVFQNRYLLEKSLYLLGMNKFSVYTNHLVPANDGGVSLGQLFIAAERRGKCV
jgi:hydrogenase maturation protein HypF